MELGVSEKRYLYKKVPRRRKALFPQIQDKAQTSSQVRSICDEIERDMKKVSQIERRNFSHKKDRSVFRERTIRIKANRVRLFELRPEHPLALSLPHKRRKRKIRSGNWKKNKTN